MNNVATPMTFAEFLQSNVGLMWSFVILAFVTISGWIVKTVLEFYKNVKLHEQQVRYEMGRDLLASRFASFENLWTRMGELAIYTDKKFSNEDAELLADELSGWYFSDKGGLYLTEATRDFYFSLQFLLVKLSREPDWKCKERPRDPKAVFEAMFSAANQDLPFDLKQATQIPHKEWLAFCKDKLWPVLETLLEEPDSDSGDFVYAAIQQVSSVLRSNLAAELQSRLDVDRPPET